MVIDGKIDVNAHRIRKLSPIPNPIPQRQSSVVSLRIISTIYPFDAPSDFSTPISRVLSMIVVYIERKITRNPIATAILIITLMNALNPGKVEDVISERKSL